MYETTVLKIVGVIDVDIHMHFTCLVEARYIYRCSKRNRGNAKILGSLTLKARRMASTSTLHWLLYQQSTSVMAVDYVHAKHSTSSRDTSTVSRHM